MKCYNITILNDADCEINSLGSTSENFFAVLSTDAFRVTVEPHQSEVVIDDDTEPECGEIVGFVDVSSDM